MTLCSNIWNICSYSYILNSWGIQTNRPLDQPALAHPVPDTTAPLAQALAAGAGRTQGQGDLRVQEQRPAEDHHQHQVLGPPVVVAKGEGWKKGVLYEIRFESNFFYLFIFLLKSDNKGFL